MFLPILHPNETNVFRLISAVSQIAFHILASIPPLTLHGIRKSNLSKSCSYPNLAPASKCRGDCLPCSLS